MNHLLFKRDFAYKFIKPTSFINIQENPKLILPLWRANRLSLIRAFIFLMPFFKKISVFKKVTISVKYKRSDKKTYKKAIYYLQVALNDTDFFMFILSALPEPKVIGTTLGYALIYPFHHFIMQVPCNKNCPVFTYKLIPQVKLLTDAKIS